MNDITISRSQAQWEAKNPVLRSGQYGFEDETGKVKIGDGVKRWSQLTYLDVPPYTLPKPSDSPFDLPDYLKLEALIEAFSMKVDLAVEDYTTDGFVWGSDDTAPWQAALNEAAALGVQARVLGRPGRVYKVKPLKFRGNLVIDLNGSTLQAMPRVGGSNVWDALLYTAGCTAANGCTGDGATVVNDVEIIGGTLDTLGRCYTAIKAQNANRVAIRRCILPSNQDKIGIRFDLDTSECVAEGNRIVSTLDSPFDTVTNAQGISCFSSTGDSSGGAYGLYGTDTVNVSAFTDPTHLSKKHQIVNNYIENGTHGISLWGADSCVVEGNTIVNPSHRGVICSPVSYRNLISGNIVYGTFSCAYLLAFGSRWNVVSDNIAYCTSSQSELNAFRASFGASDNHFTGNYAYGVLGAAFRAFTGAINNSFIGNKAESCGVGLEFRSLVTDDGYQQNVNTPAMVGNSAQSNDFLGCGVGIQLRSGTSTTAGSTPASAAGVAVPLSCAIIGNRIRNSTTYGVLIVEDTAGVYASNTGVNNVTAFANVVASSGNNDWQTQRANGHWAQFQANSGAGQQGVHRLPVSGNAIEWRDSTDALRAFISSAGAMVTSGRRAAGATVTSTVAMDYVNTASAGNIGLRVDGQLAQTADLHQWTLNAGPSGVVVPISRIDKNGGFITARHAAPADADMNAGDLAIWFDQTNGAAKLMIKAKQADGTVRTGSLALA